MVASYASSTACCVQGGNNPVGAKPSGVEEGDLLIAFCSSSSGTGGSWTPPAGEGWISGDADTAIGTAAALFYREADSSEASTYTFTRSSTSNNAVLVIVRIAKNTFNPDTPIGVNDVSGLATSTSCVIPSVTATEDDSLLLQIVNRVANTGGTWTEPGSATPRSIGNCTGPVPMPFGIGDEVVNSGATGTRTWTCTGTSNPSRSAMLTVNPFVEVEGDSDLDITATLSASGGVSTEGNSDLNVTASLAASGGVSTEGDSELEITVTLEAEGVVESALEGSSSLNVIFTLESEGNVGGGGTGSLSEIARFRAANFLGIEEPELSTIDIGWLLREYWGRRAGIEGDLSTYSTYDIISEHFPGSHFIKDVF